MHQKGKKFYHQSRVPVDVQELLGRKWINHSLKVGKVQDAERINNRLTSDLDDLYCTLRTRIIAWLL